MLNNKVVCYIRSTSIINDSRASKEITTLINNGYEVIIIGWDRQSLIEGDIITINNKDVKAIMFKYKSAYGVSLKSLIGMLKFQFFIKRTLKKYKSKIDIIHACDFDTGYIACNFAKKNKKKIVYDIYDYYVDSRPTNKVLSKIIQTKEDDVINHADITIICGEWRKKQIRTSNPKNVLVIHNSPNIYFDSKGVKNKKIVLGYVGVLQSDRLIMEIANEVINHKEFELKIGGFGPYEEQLKNMTKKYSNIKFYGSMKYEEVLKLESKCDFLFATYNPDIPNHKYSAPNKIYEAMALGKPIAVCKGTGIDDIISKNNLGVVCKYDASDVLKSIKDYQSLNTYNSKEAKRLFREKYSWDIMEKKLIEAYKKIG